MISSDKMAKGKIIGALGGVGAIASYYAKRITSEYLSKLSEDIKILEEDLWVFERRAQEKFISMFGLKSELRIIYKDGKEVFIKNRLEGASQLPSDAPFEFSRKWMEGVLYPLDELKVAEVTCHSPDPKNNFVMSGTSL